MSTEESSDPQGRDPEVVINQETAGKDDLSYFIVRLAGSTYACPSERVEFIGAIEEPTPVPTAPSHMLGVFHSRGRILAAVDLVALLRLPWAKIKTEGDAKCNRRLVVLMAQKSPFAVIVDEAIGFFQVSRNAIREMDKDGERLDPTMEYAKGQFDHGDQIATILDLDVILSVMKGGAVPVTIGSVAEKENDFE